MDGMSGLVSWTDAQWKRVRQAVTEEANRVRVASSFLPIYGPLPPSTQVVPSEVVDESNLTVDDAATSRIVELSVDFTLRQAQVAEEELSSALLLFRRAANIVARAEDRTIFQGFTDRQPADMPRLEIRDGRRKPSWVEGHDPGASGLLDAAVDSVRGAPGDGERLISAIVEAITKLEGRGQLSPFYCVLGNKAFVTAQTPNGNSLVLPSDRITPFLGHALLRTSTIPDNRGLVIALAGDPVDLALAVDVAPQMLNVNDHGQYRFRVYERFALRIKERSSIVRLESL
jgi:uncharacterized linocin/CFP29 family protein